MAPESGSGPRSNPPNATRPQRSLERWRETPVGSWEPDPSHPDYPFKRRSREVLDDQRNLDENEHVQIALAILRRKIDPWQQAFLLAGEVERGELSDEVGKHIRAAVIAATAS